MMTTTTTDSLDNNYHDDMYYDDDPMSIVRALKESFEQTYCVPPDAKDGPKKPPRTFAQPTGKTTPPLKNGQAQIGRVGDIASSFPKKPNLTPPKGNVTPTALRVKPIPPPKSKFITEATAKAPRPRAKPPAPPPRPSRLALQRMAISDDTAYAVYDRQHKGRGNPPNGTVSEFEKPLFHPQPSVSFSHDYETVSGNARCFAANLRRTASDEIIYAKPYRNSHVTSDCSPIMVGSIAGDETPPLVPPPRDEIPKLYYASATIVRGAPATSTVASIPSRSEMMRSSFKTLRKRVKHQITNASFPAAATLASRLNYSTSSVSSALLGARDGTLKKSRPLDRVELIIKAREYNIVTTSAVISSGPIYAASEGTPKASPKSGSPTSSSGRRGGGGISPNSSCASFATESETEGKIAPDEAKRSSVIRRTTIMYHEHELAFRKRKSPQLFEMFAFVGLEVLEHCKSRGSYIPPGGDEHTKYIPLIKYSYPRRLYKKNTQEGKMLTSLPYFVFPDYTTVGPMDSMKECYFIVSMTNMTGARKFAYCCRYLPTDVSPDEDQKFLPSVLVLLSPVHNSYFYRELLREAISRLKVNLKLCIDFLKSAFHQPFPQHGAKVTISTHLVGDLVLVNDTSHEQVISDTHRALTVLGVANFLKVYQALLAEKRILITAGDLETLSACIQGLISVLYPFKWPHTLIPVVPDCHIDLCFAPFPYVMGVLRSNQRNMAELRPLFQSDEEQHLLVMDVDMGEIKNTDYTDVTRHVPRRIRDGLESLMTLISRKINDHREGDELVAELFLLVMIELVGHYRNSISRDEDGLPVLEVESLITDHRSKSVRRFLAWFTQMGMFQVWRRQKMDDADAEDLFDSKILEVRKVLHSKQQTLMRKIKSKVRHPLNKFL